MLSIEKLRKLTTQPHQMGLPSQSHSPLSLLYIALATLLINTNDYIIQNQ